MPAIARPEGKDRVSSCASRRAVADRANRDRQQSKGEFLNDFPSLRPQDRWTAAEPVLACDVCASGVGPKEVNMNGLIYLIGLIVVIMAILSFFGLR
jgi:hypothetical protein